MKRQWNALGTRLVTLCWASVLLLTATTLCTSLAATPKGSDSVPKAADSGSFSVQDVLLNLQTLHKSSFLLAMGGGFRDGDDDDDRRGDRRGNDDGDNDDDKKGDRRGGAPVPEPATWMGLASLLALCAFAALLRKRK